MSFGGGNKLVRWRGFRDGGVGRNYRVEQEISGLPWMNIREGDTPVKWDRCKDGAPGHKVIEVGV